MLHFLDNLNEEQRKILKQFRLSLEDILTPEVTDYDLVKYLRARNFDLKVAVKIYKENYYNRITFGVNTIVDTYTKPEVAQKYETAGILGFAKNGTLIRYTACGRLDFYGFIMSMTLHDLCLYFSHMMEIDRQMLKEQNLKTLTAYDVRRTKLMFQYALTGKNIQEITYIMDFEGFTLSQVLHKNVIEMGLDYTRLLQDCYPEVWSHVLMVNAPKYFDRAFSLFKPVIRMQSLERMFIADKASTKDLLLKYIDENVLPAFLGGSRVDSNGDPECKEFITFGGKVPEKFYLQNCRIPLSPSDPNVKCMTVRARSMKNISCVVREANTKLRLQVKSENGSLYFSVLYREFGPDPYDIELPEEDEYLDETADNFKYKQISVELRGQCHCAQEDATVLAPWPGIYVTRFNNSSNWFTSRKIMVKLELFPPSKEAK